MMRNFANLLTGLVGARGFEPRTSCAQGRRATRLRYAPTRSGTYSSPTCAFAVRGARLRCVRTAREHDRQGVAELLGYQAGLGVLNCGVYTEELADLGHVH
jgi:hypothetical protein